MYVYISWTRPAGDSVASGGHLPDPRSGCRLEEAGRGFTGAAGRVTERDRLPQGPTRPSPPPGPSPGGSLLQGPTPKASQTARAETRPGTVLVPRSSRPRLGHRASRGGWSRSRSVPGAVSRWRRKGSSRSRPPRSHPARDRPCSSIGSMCIDAGRAAGGCAPPIPTWPPISMGPPPIGWVRG